MYDQYRVCVFKAGNKCVFWPVCEQVRGQECVQNWGVVCIQDRDTCVFGIGVKCVIRAIVILYVCLQLRLKVC